MIRKNWIFSRVHAAAVLGPITLALQFAHSSGAQSDATPGGRLSFDVSVIKPSGPKSEFKMSFLPGSHMILSHVGLEFLVKYAYGLRDGQISSGPDWIRTKPFDIDAKCDPPVGGDIRDMNNDQRHAYQQQMLLRLQSLLVDRFQLKLRQEIRQMSVYALLVDKNGPKFQESPKADADGRFKQGAIVRPGHIEAYHTNMEITARALSQVTGETVIDHTGLNGSYDFKLDWTPDSSGSQNPVDANADRPDAHPPSDPSGPSLFTALHEQLGLKLKSTKAPVPFFVIESASLPTAN